MMIDVAYRHSKGYGGDRGKAVSDVKSVYKTIDRRQLDLLADDN
jgi:hypothetical protein